MHGSLLLDPPSYKTDKPSDVSCMNMYTASPVFNSHTYSMTQSRNYVYIPQVSTWHPDTADRGQVGHSDEHTSVGIVFMNMSCPQGNPRPQKQLPEKLSFFTESIPPTTSKHLGSRINTANNREILRIEMTTCHKKRKTDLETYYS